MFKWVSLGQTFSDMPRLAEVIKQFQICWKMLIKISFVLDSLLRSEYCSNCKSYSSFINDCGYMYQVHLYLTNLYLCYCIDFELSHYL